MQIFVSDLLFQWSWFNTQRINCKGTRRGTGQANTGYSSSGGQYYNSSLLPVSCSRFWKGCARIPPLPLHRWPFKGRALPGDRGRDVAGRRRVPVPSGAHGRRCPHLGLRYSHGPGYGSCCRFTWLLNCFKLWHIIKNLGVGVDTNKYQIMVFGLMGVYVNTW